MFTLIAYRSDGSDYCRGCCMGAWSSKHELYINLNAQQLRERIVELKTERYYDERQDGYEFAVLASINDSIYRVYGDLDFVSNNDAGDYWEKIDELETKVADIFKDANEIIKNKKIQLAHQKTIEKAIAEEKARDARKQKELALLIELKAKYEKE